jgi:hypothetical protein
MHSRGQRLEARLAGGFCEGGDDDMRSVAVGRSNVSLLEAVRGEAFASPLGVPLSFRRLAGHVQLARV